MVSVLRSALCLLGGGWVVDVSGTQGEQERGDEAHLQSWRGESGRWRTCETHFRAWNDRTR